MNRVVHIAGYQKQLLLNCRQCIPVHHTIAHLASFPRLLITTPKDFRSSNVEPCEVDHGDSPPAASTISETFCLRNDYGRTTEFGRKRRMEKGVWPSRNVSDCGSIGRFRPNEVIQRMTFLKPGTARPQSRKSKNWITSQS